VCVCVNKHGAWDANTLVFPSPSVTTAAEYNVTIQLDGSLSEQSAFTVREDPVFNSFENDKKTHAGEVLQIQVKH